MWIRVLGLPPESKVVIWNYWTTIMTEDSSMLLYTEVAQTHTVTPLAPPPARFRTSWDTPRKPAPLSRGSIPEKRVTFRTPRFQTNTSTTVWTVESVQGLNSRGMTKSETKRILCISSSLARTWHKLQLKSYKMRWKGHQQRVWSIPQPIPTIQSLSTHELVLKVSVLLWEI